MFSTLDFSAVFTAGGLAKLLQIVLADLTMAGDNVVIMGTIAAGLPERERKRVLLLGVVFALAFLIGFALIATQLLKVVGLLFVGGVLLLWVAFTMFRDLRAGHGRDPALAATTAQRVPKSFLQAAVQITLADLSMSVDNVLVVAAIARDNPAVLFIGLTLSVLMMGLAANLVARLVQRYPIIGWIGFVIILCVAGDMIWQGLTDRQVGLLPLLQGDSR